jgi:hypothetical protein
LNVIVLSDIIKSINVNVIQILSKYIFILFPLLAIEIINVVKFIPSIIHSKFQEMLKFENSNSGKVSGKYIINSKEPKY